MSGTMVQIQNSDAVNAIRDGAKLSISEGFPQDLGKTVVPVMDMTPRFHRTCDVVEGVLLDGAASATIYTTPTNKDFYLNSVSLHVTGDDINNSTYTEIRVTIGTLVKRLIGCANVGGNWHTPGGVSMSFPVPIKIDRNTAITINTNDGTAEILAHGSITGFTVEAQM